MTRAAGSRVRWVLLALVAGLVVLPSAEIGIFSGLPLDGPGEFIVALLVLPILLSSEVRDRWFALVARLGSVGARAVLAIAVVAMAAKVGLFVSGESPGFRACYQSLVTVTGGAAAQTPRDECETSYDNPLSRHGATRLDPTIDFGLPATGERADPMLSAEPWDLDFFNSNRFNFYDWVPGVPDRRALPFGVTWTGEIEEAAATTYIARIVGEAAVTIDGGVPTSIGPAYDEARVVRIEIPAGRHEVSIAYQYDRQLERPDDPAGPYAALELEGADGEPVRPIGAATSSRALSLFVDVVTGVLALSVLAAVVAALRWKVVVAPIAAVLTAVMIETSSLERLGVGLVEVGILLLSCALLVRRPSCRSSLLVMAFIAFVAIELVRAHDTFSSFDEVVLRPGGDDYLTYESQAHAVLGGSLRGEEDVFVYSPAFRYLLALGHAIFGNGDARLSVTLLVALSLAAFAALTAWWSNAFPMLGKRTVRNDEALLCAGFLGAAATTVLLVASPAVAYIVRLPLSEAPTWALAPAALLLATAAPARWRFALLAVALALALTVRANHAPGLLVIAIIGVIGIVRARDLARSWRPRTLVLGLACFLAVALLPAVHNIVYGERLVFFADSASIPLNAPIPLGDALDLCCDAELRDVFGRQARMVIVAGTGAVGDFVATIRWLQVGWVASLVALVGCWRRLSRTAILVAALPLAFLGPHLFFQVGVYYPRHIVLGYLMMGLASAYVFSVAARRPHETANDVVTVDA